MNDHQNVNQAEPEAGEEMSGTDLVAPATKGALARFKPEAARRNDAKADAVIEYAQRVKDWPLLTRAVDQKIEDQREFVGWWREKVRGKGKNRNSADPRYLQEQAESLTGITHQQVSKWNKRLSREDEYRAALYGVAYRKAMGEEYNHRAEGTGENEWHTPIEYVNAARSAMGGIDLDAASSAHAQLTIAAPRFFSIENDEFARQMCEAGN